MAKGVEDTFMYTYNRFVAHNEVGDSPENFGLSVAAFHNAMLERQKHWPLALNATATHDTKRGEDVRARLNVLSDIADQWIGKVREWMQMNAALKQNGIPSANDEYFIYQTLAGSYPIPYENTEDYSKRLAAYLEKALREGKERSDWATPDSAYESATKEFAEALLSQNNSFYKSFQQFQTTIVDFGIVNALVQTILKFTCPGVPDVYQGCELWDLSLVDPDNRRAVDYVRRQQLLQEIEDKKDEERYQADLWERRNSGQIKLWVTQKLMQLRSSRSQLFTNGDYVPLKTMGTYSDNLIAYARRFKDDWLLVVLPLHLASINGGNNFQTIDWLDTAIILPESSAGKWKSVFDNRTIIQQNKVEPALLFQKIPFAVLHGKAAEKERGAGILLHISSLPAAFGIGDLGPAAYEFADFLKRSGQKYWQMLPLNPTEAGQGHSPYSAVSSMAGNPVFISPELLVKDGFLSEKDVEDLKVPATSVVDFEQASAVKSSLIEKAYQCFLSGNNEVLRQHFDQFCVRENDWLRDYTLYTLIKQKQNAKPWYEWPQSFNDRDASALAELEKQHASAIELIKWTQFIFYRQWRSLKQYCNNGNIQLVGDLPFYVSYDSADVWAHREIFLLDTDGKPLGMAGVPPDAFSDDGQLWGMPVYNWDVLKQNEYKWWIERLQKNVELFDIIRLDHFRAFEAYWQVPAGAETARQGSWKEGPGADFFQHLKTAIQDLPFVAEDLGDVDEKVFALRDEFRLPGMKVLQFAFGKNMPTSDYIPHNYEKNFFVYTGTHDNNTALGWYQTEIDDATKDRLHQYAGKTIEVEELTSFLCQLALSSVAKVAILPIQDVLNLGADARMNTPASTTTNWSWRLLPEQISTAAEGRLLSWTTMYNRL
jgi:4-alpha-glucanotransferase